MKVPTKKFLLIQTDQVVIAATPLKSLCVRLLVPLLLLGFAVDPKPVAAENPPQFEWVRQVEGSWYVFGGGLFLDEAGNAYQIGEAIEDSTFGGTVFTNAGTFIANYDRSGALVWAVQDGSGYGYGSFSTTPGVKDVAVANGVYALSSMMDPVNFGGQSLTNPSGNNSLVLTKHYTNGEPVWAKLVCWADVAWAMGLAVDAASNSYIVGITGPSVGTSTTNVSGTTTLTKCDPDGNVIWIKAYDCGSWYLGIKDVALDAGGNVVVAGSFDRTLVMDGTTLTNAGGNDMFVAKFDSDGHLVWAKRAGGPGGDGWNRLTISPAGEVYLTGSFEEGVSFDTLTLPGGGASHYYFAVKYDTDGHAVWARQLCPGGSRSEVAADSMGHYFVASECDDATITFAKYDGEGNLLWSKSIPNTFAPSAMLTLDGMRADAIGNCYMSGTLYADSATFDGITLTKTNGYTDAFLAKLSTTTPPMLTVSRKAENFQLRWSALAAGFYLESATAVNASTLWVSNSIPSIVEGVSNVVTVLPSDQQRFFRLRRP